MHGIQKQGVFRTVSELLLSLPFGTFCTQNQIMLLHDDRDFEPMAEHLKLRTVAL